MFQVFVGVYVESCKDTCVFQVFVGVYVESCKDTCVFQVFVGVYVESCKDTCVFQGLVCKPSYFNDINLITFIESHGAVNCELIRSVYSLNAPCFDPVTKTCCLQKHGQLFSCVHREKDVKKYVKRLCLCRD